MTNTDTKKGSTSVDIPHTSAHKKGFIFFHLEIQILGQAALILDKSLMMIMPEETQTQMALFDQIFLLLILVEVFLCW